MNIPDEVYKKLNLKKPDIKTVIPLNEFKAKEFLSKGTMNSPAFCRVTYLKENIKNILMACSGIEDIDTEEDFVCRTVTYAHFRYIDGEKQGYGVTAPLSDIVVTECVMDTKRLQAVYDRVMSRIHCTITTCIYPDEKQPTDLTPYELYCLDFEPIETHTYEPEGVRTLEEAERWLLLNHPSEYIGHSIQNNVGDFSFGCVPQAYAEDGEDFMSREGRERIIRRIAENRGMEVGEFTYDDSESVRISR